MLNKIKLIAVLMTVTSLPAFAETEINLADFDADGSVFLRITALEQDKVLMRLEKERAQLELDLSRIEAEKQRLTIGEKQDANITNDIAAEIEAERKKLSDDMEIFRRQMEEAKTIAAAPKAETKSAPLDTAAAPKAAVDEGEFDISEHYKLINITGAEDELTATVENLGTGQRRKVTEGKSMDGFDVKLISADEGVVFEKDGENFILGLMKSAR